jgi:hypothetical protein
MILRHKLPNRRCRFWCPNQETRATGFKVKLGETVTTGFEAKLRQIVPVVLRPNWKKLSPPILKPNQDKSSQWFWGQTTNRTSQWFWCQTTNKTSTLVFRLNQKICAPRLHVYGANRTRCHITSRSSSHWVSDLCLIIPASLHQVSVIARNWLGQFGLRSRPRSRWALKSITIE